MGGVVKNPIGTLGRGLLAGASGGISEFAQKNPFGAPISNPINSALPINNDYLKTGSLFAKDNPAGVSGPFSLDINQFNNDRSAINELGSKQYDETLASIDKNSSAQQEYASQILKRMTPEIEEGLNSQHLLNSSALPQELGRQASNLAQDVASQRANAMQQALTGKQGFETGALQRGLSMEDFINQANVSKSLGAAFTPQQASGKQNFGTVAQGVGALSPWGRVATAGKTPATPAA